MSGRILVVERDPHGRMVMDRVLGAEGFATDAVATTREAEQRLERSEYAVAIVDELAGTGALLDEVRSVRRRWPRLPLIVTGTLLSQRILIELLRLGVDEALPKPFVPAELREAVARVLARAAPDEARALDWAAAIAALRTAFVDGDLDRAHTLLDRAFAITPLDSEAVGLAALLAELTGDDRRAAQLYRASLVLSDEESVPPPDPREGIARIAAYGGARPVAAIAPGRIAWIVDDATGFKPGDAPDGPHVVVLTVGLSSKPRAMLHLRESAARGFALSLGDERPETLADVVRRLGAAHVYATDATRARIDVARIEALRGGAS